MLRAKKKRSRAEVPDLATKIDHRIEGLRTWLGENAPECTEEQKHLDEGTPERTYWHYGYLVALKDVRRLLVQAGVLDANASAPMVQGDRKHGRSSGIH